jgi:hypothetical protein
VELYLHSPICLHGIVLNNIIKYKDHFTFSLALSSIISEDYCSLECAASTLGGIRVALKMEAACYSESAFEGYKLICQTTRRHIPEYSNLRVTVVETSNLHIINLKHFRI